MQGRGGQITFRQLVWGGSQVGTIEAFLCVLTAA